MQKLVGAGHLEYYPKIGIAHKPEESHLVKSIDRIQRSMIVGYFLLQEFRTGLSVKRVKIYSDV